MRFKLPWMNNTIVKDTLDYVSDLPDNDAISKARRTGASERGITLAIIRGLAYRQGRIDAQLSYGTGTNPLDMRRRLATYDTLLKTVMGRGVDAYLKELKADTFFSVLPVNWE